MRRIVYSSNNNIVKYNFISYSLVILQFRWYNHLQGNQLYILLACTEYNLNHKNKKLRVRKKVVRENER